MRKSEILFEAITNLRDDLIEAAQTHRFTKKSTNKSIALKRWMPLAAGLAVVIGLWALLASGGLRMGGMSSDTASGGDSGDSGGTAQEDGAAADGAAPEEEPAFSDTAGPILSLTLQEQNDAIAAQRQVTMDFAGYGANADFWEDRYRIGVTDHYTLTNTSDTDQTVTLLYPVAGDLGELDTPEITVNGQTVETVPVVGSDAGFDRDADYLDWTALLEDESYLADALDGPEDLSGVEVIVYTVSDQQGPAGEDAATLALEFSYDPAETTVMQYGFNGMSRGEGGTVQYSGSGFVNGNSENWYLIVLGKDIQNPQLQGYEDGGCDAGEELNTVTGTLTRRETTLEEILRTVTEDYWQKRSAQGGRSSIQVPYEAFYAAVADSVLEDTMYLPLLEEFLFAQGWQADRVVWFSAQATIPAGGSIEVEAAYTKAASLNFGPSDMDYKDLCGYEILPYAGSSLTFTGQTARVVNGETVPGWYGNLTFGDADLTAERYDLYTHQ